MKNRPKRPTTGSLYLKSLMSLMHIVEILTLTYIYTYIYTLACAYMLVSVCLCAGLRIKSNLHFELVLNHQWRDEIRAPNISSIYERHAPNVESYGIWLLSQHQHSTLMCIAYLRGWVLIWILLICFFLSLWTWLNRSSMHMRINMHSD